MTMHFRDIAARAAADGVITPQEILLLSQEGWADGRISPDEAEALFVANDNIDNPSEEWSAFFVNAVSEWLVNGIDPKGYVTGEQGEWLVRRIDHDGHVKSMTELELLVRVFERAESVPPRLRGYALDQIEHAVLTGEGPTRCGGQLGKGNVTEAEARLMRRIIFSSGSERPAAVSKSEAELLFRIKDAALGANNSPAWKLLFVQGVGNYLMGFASHQPLEIERARELEAFMDRPSRGIGGFLTTMMKSDVDSGLKSLFRRKTSTPDSATLAATAREVDAEEQAWLNDRIDGNNKVDEYDRALLDFIAEETGEAG
jgi:hypothetical protein